MTTRRGRVVFLLAACLAACADGSVYFTVSKLHLDPSQAVPYKIFMIQPRR